MVVDFRGSKSVFRSLPLSDSPLSTRTREVVGLGTKILLLTYL